MIKTIENILFRDFLGRKSCFNFSVPEIRLVSTVYIVNFYSNFSFQKLNLISTFSRLDLYSNFSLRPLYFLSNFSRSNLYSNFSLQHSNLL